MNLPSNTRSLVPAIPFSKYSGCGNDFILIDNRKGIFPSDNTLLVKRLCQRCSGIGADGIVLLENNDEADFQMRIFNADGSEAEMCGNGLRCLGKFIREIGTVGNSFRIAVMRRHYTIGYSGEDVVIKMSPPTEAEWDIRLEVEGQIIHLDYLDTGVPHVVLFSEKLKEFDLKSLGPKIRHHPRFSPRGTNVDIARVGVDGTVEIRTYERGVEGETLACGTGAAAVAVVAAVKKGLCSPIRVRPLSGEELTFTLSIVKDRAIELTMSGPAIRSFTGSFEISDC